MPIPDYETLMLPVLRAFESGAKSVNECLPLLIRDFGISDEEAAELIPSGRVTVLANRAHWARTYMSKAGLLNSPKRNVHQVTDLGRALLAEGLQRIDNSVLSRFDGFGDWRTSSTKSEDASVVPVPSTSVPSVQFATPDEAMSSAFTEIQASLEAELLDRLIVMHPARFERLILDLLKAMGYGAGTFGKHEMTKASGDGGIDGIIHEDALGLDAVYIQAKRYQADTKVGRPAIQQFIGSLTGEGATKGVFVTTSDFSADARGYLAKVQHRVVLIGGTELARLMIRHGVGVRDRVSYVIRSVDEDYFSDPEG
jgi:restriction system protein